MLKNVYINKGTLLHVVGCLCVGVTINSNKNMKLQGPMLLLLCSNSQSIAYPSMSLCVVHEKQNQKITMCLKAVFHYNTCPHVKHTQVHKTRIPDVLLLPLHPHTETSKRYIFTWMAFWIFFFFSSVYPGMPADNSLMSNAV